MSSRLLSLLILAFCGLSACAVSGEKGAPSAVDGLNSKPVAASASGAADGEAGEGTENADGSAPEEPAPPPPPPSPDSFVGLTAEALKTLLGAPSHTTQEPPAQIWRYSLDLCKVFFFLYESDKGGIPTVKHVDVAIIDGAQIQPQLCLSGIGLSDLPAEPDEKTLADPSRDLIVGPAAPAAESD